MKAEQQHGPTNPTLLTHPRLRQNTIPVPCFQDRLTQKMYSKNSEHYASKRHMTDVCHTHCFCLTQYTEFGISAALTFQPR